MAALWIGVGGWTAAGNKPVDPRPQAREIAAKLPKLRKLAFKSEVPLDIKTAAQARELMRERVHKLLTPEEIQNSRDAGVLLALWPGDFDLEQASINLESSQLLAFYAHDAKRMVLIDGDDAAFSQVVDADGKPLAFRYMKEMTLAHELTHALQDQYFDLSRLERIKHDDDRQLAFQAIVEGDATLTGLMYTFKGLDGAQARAALGELINLSYTSREMVSAPDTITMQTKFVYGAGVGFVAYAFKRGGFEAVNKLLRVPPSSTREILNPQKFYDHPSPPQKIDVHGYEKGLPGWRAIDDNTLGEMMTLAMLHQTLGDAENWAPMCNSWRSDKFLLLANGSARAMIGFIVFADPAMASHFADTYSHILDLVHHDRVPHLVQAQNKTVIVLVGEPAKRASALLPTLRAETKFDASNAASAIH